MVSPNDGRRSHYPDMTADVSRNCSNQAGPAVILSATSNWRCHSIRTRCLSVRSRGGAAFLGRRQEPGLRVILELPNERRQSETAAEADLLRAGGAVRALAQPDVRKGTRVPEDSGDGAQRGRESPLPQPDEQGARQSLNDGALRPEELPIVSSLPLFADLRCYEVANASGIRGRRRQVVDRYGRTLRPRTVTASDGVTVRFGRPTRSKLHTAGDTILREFPAVEQILTGGSSRASQE